MENNESNHLLFTKKYLNKYQPLERTLKIKFNIIYILLKFFSLEIGILFSLSEIFLNVDF